MEKVISLFKRDYEGNRLVYDELVQGAEWVQTGEGIATEKLDGTACLIEDRRLSKRYDVKKGRTPPAQFQPAQEADPVTGHWPGWVPVRDSAPEDKWHREAWEHGGKDLPDGTYELVGPKVQGNKYRLTDHRLWRHGANPLEDVPRTFQAIKAYLEDHPEHEGIVWHHSDGRMVKIKRRDFGLKWQGVPTEPA